MAKQSIQYNLETQISELVKDNPEIKEIYIFGSRRYKTKSIGSDVDLLFFADGNEKLPNIRKFQNKNKYLDLFACIDGTAVSCYNSTQISYPTKEELLNKLDALLIWDINKGFHQEANIIWIYETIANYNPAYSFFVSGGSIPMDQFKKVFIVHGHDTKYRDAVEDYIKDLGLVPVILCKSAGGSKTIIERIEEETDVRCAIVLYTPCDIGMEKAKAKAKNPILFRRSLKDRARQNVVFEHGFLDAKLGRDKVIAIVENGVELPNDIAGVVYVSRGDGDQWKDNLKKELEKIGIIKPVTLSHPSA